jgi:hypothetical protein
MGQKCMMFLLKTCFVRDSKIRIYIKRILSKSNLNHLDAYAIKFYDIGFKKDNLYELL